MGLKPLADYIYNDPAYVRRHKYHLRDRTCGVSRPLLSQGALGSAHAYMPTAITWGSISMAMGRHALNSKV